jgi:hypothetical protein
VRAFRVIPFYGKGDEWPTWNKKFLAKAKRCGFKDLLLRKLSIAKTDEVYEVEIEVRKKKRIITDLNEFAYTELILSIDERPATERLYLTK